MSKLIDYQIALRGDIGVTVLQLVAYTPVARTSNLEGIQAAIVGNHNRIEITALPLPPYDKSVGYPQTLDMVSINTAVYPNLITPVVALRSALQTQLPTLVEDITIPLATRVRLSSCVGNHEVERTFLNYQVGAVSESALLDELAAAGIPTIWPEFR